MKRAGEWYVPDILGGPDRYLKGWAELESSIRPKHHRAVIQAGGHIGVFPRELSRKFKRVYTFEPEFQNFECLVRNAVASNIFAARAALDAFHGCKDLTVQPRNTGGHQMTRVPGATPSYCIDDLALTDCDLILLDLEGFEFWALMGATATISRCRPLVIVEQNKKSRGQGFQAGAIELLMNSLDYRVRGTAGENIIFEAV